MPSVAKKLVIVQNNDAAAAEPSAAPTAETACGRKSCGCWKPCCSPPGQPLDEATLARRLPDGVNVKEALAALKAEYATRGVNLVRIGKKWMFRTADDLAWLLTKQTVETRKLSRAAIETLAIIAYHQPVTRAEIEEIRGVVAAAGTLDVLLRTGWIRPRGRRKAPGRPITYGTTEQFLIAFRAGGGGRSARPRGAQRRRPARRQSAAGLCGADAVRRRRAARGRGPAGAGRSRLRVSAAAHPRELTSRELQANIAASRGITAALRRPEVLVFAACGA